MGAHVGAAFPFYLRRPQGQPINDPLALHRATEWGEGREDRRSSGPGSAISSVYLPSHDVQQPHLPENPKVTIKHLCSR